MLTGLILMACSVCFLGFFGVFFLVLFLRSLEGYERKDFSVFCVTKVLKITNDILKRSAGCLGGFVLMTIWKTARSQQSEGKLQLRRTASGKFSVAREKQTTSRISCV